MFKWFFFIVMIASAPADRHYSVSAYAVDSRSGKVVLDERGSACLVPSSCMKVVTTAAALSLLGPEARFETFLEHDGAIEEGVLRGNVYIRGGGDPCLGSDRIAGSLSWQDQIDVWATAIEKLGIKRIEGAVIGDASEWEKALAVPSWAWEDLGNYYGAGASALSFHENTYTLVFRPGKKVGSSASIVRVEPPVAIAFENEVTTGPVGSGDRACIYGSEFSFEQAVRGTVPAGVDEFSIRGAIPDPAKCSAELLSAALEKRGIVIGHNLGKKGKRVVFYVTQSPPLKEIVYWTNQESINLYAEHLLKKMGGGSTVAGTKAVTEFFRSEGIDLKGFQMADGSGLSRMNLITAKQLVSILMKMKKSEIFIKSLPQERELCRAKSGSMTRVKGYAGFKDEIAFAILVNHASSSEAEESIAEILARFYTQVDSKFGVR